MAVSLSGRYLTTGSNATDKSIDFGADEMMVGSMQLRSSEVSNDVQQISRDVLIDIAFTGTRAGSSRVSSPTINQRK